MAERDIEKLASKRWLKLYSISWNKNEKTECRLKTLKKTLIREGQKYFNFFQKAIQKTILNKKKSKTEKSQFLAQKYEEFAEKLVKWWEQAGRLDKMEQIPAKKPKSVPKIQEKPNLPQVETIQNKKPKIPQFDRKLFDKDYIRISTKNKVPQAKDWTNPSFREKRTIAQLLEKNGEYGLRTGKKIGIGSHYDYYFICLIFQKKPYQQTWHDWIPLSLTPFSDFSYIETEATYHFYLLIKELPPTCSLSRNGADKSLGIIFAEGKQVISEGSNVNNFIYHFIKKQQDFAVYETVKELEEDLAKTGIYLSSRKEITQRDYKVFQLNSPPVVLEQEPVLNEQQKLVKKLVLEGKNIFLTGSAGTGKSFVLRQVISALQNKYSREQVGITAMTGTGANIISGFTLHSYLGIGVMGNFNTEVLYTKIMNSRKAKRNWYNCKALIVDEVSMLDGELFDKLERIARRIRRNNEPFGGIQLILIGDFCQLPPTGKLVSLYAFEARSWNKCINKVVNLKQVYRQKKDWFINYLQAIRFGLLSKKMWENMLNWCGKEPEWPQDGIKPTALFSTNREVANVNEKELARLPERSVFFLAEDKEKVAGKLELLVKSCLAKEKLELKVGTQVMLIKNWHEEKLVNGSQGTIVRFTPNGLPVVRFTNGRDLTIERDKWERVEGYDYKGKPIVSAVRKQIPLILAWAITIDKSQGQSIERLKVDLTKCWRGGQVYVALSRATEPKYLWIINFAYNRLWCDPKVKEFYQALENEGRTVSQPIKQARKDWHKQYLKIKVRNKWKEFVVAYKTNQKWPYKDIKFLLNKEKDEYFTTFLKVIEKSITNSKNLAIYRKLIQYLKSWQQDVKKSEFSKESIKKEVISANLLVNLTIQKKNS